MTRQHKYRAWDKKHKKWSEPFGLFEITDGFIKIGENYCYEDDVEVVEFTGLKDSKGVEVFEGDVLEIVVEFPQFKPQVKGARVKIIFDDGIKALMSEPLGKYKDDNRLSNLLGLMGAEGMEVIGSVHANPELLTNE